MLSCDKIEGEMSMKKGEEISDKEFKLKFDNFNDSRCPEGVNCITDGFVQVEMTATDRTNQVDSSFVFISNDPAKTSVSIFGYQIDYSDFTPYPKEGVSVSESEYRLILALKKL